MKEKNYVVQTANREKEYILTMDENRIMVDFGRQSFAMKNSRKITDHLQECFWYNGNEKENLITEFIRN